MLRFRGQKGLSLVSLLVGLLISMLCILAGLTLYKNLVNEAVDSKISTPALASQPVAHNLILQLR